MTLYELLKLEYAFPSSDRQELMQQIAEKDPTAPRRINSAIPQHLETAILKAIEKEPQDTDALWKRAEVYSEKGHTCFWDGDSERALPRPWIHDDFPPQNL